MSPIPAKVLTVAKQHRSKLSEMPDPEWYLEQFRSHIGTIHELFKVCPPQRWKALSWSIANALAEVGEKAGVKAGHYIHIEDMSRKEKRFGKVEAVAGLHRSQPSSSVAGLLLSRRPERVLEKRIPSRGGR